jgi:hypothetical protein
VNGNFGIRPIPRGKGGYRADMVKMPMSQYNVLGTQFKLIKKSDYTVAFFTGVYYGDSAF